MKTKIEKTCSREDLIDHLEHLLEQLRAGAVEAGGQNWRVPSSIETSSVIKEKNGVLRYKLEWRWPTLGDYDTPRREEVVKQQASFKQIKKELAGSFRRLKEAVVGGLTPDGKLLDEFVAQSRALVDAADPEWLEAAREYMDHVENLLRGARQNDKDALLHEVNDLENRMRTCHREFR